MRIDRLVVAIPCVLALSACQQTGYKKSGAGTVCDYPASSADESTYVDCLVNSATASTTQTLVGCSYPVRTPSVAETRADEAHVGADPVPRGVHASFASDASTTFAVDWSTDLLTTTSKILFGTDESAVTAADGATAGVEARAGYSVAYETANNLGDTVFHRNHEAHVCGLVADTVYYYKVGGPGHWSSVYEYRTAPVVGSTASWRFAVSGDSRTPQNNRWARSQKGLYDLAAPIRLQVFSGDAVFLGSNQYEWDAFFASTEQTFTTDQLLASVPFMVTNGNHDGLAVNYLAQFALPQDVSPGEIETGEEWYSYDYGNAHFVVLNDTVMSTSVLTNEERAFLSADLAAVNRATTPWIFVIHHQPLYTCLSTHQPNTAVRASWQPLFDQYGVDIVFAGHNHVYERSKPIRGLDSGGGIVAASGANGVPTISGGTPSGTLYVVSAGVGAELYGVSNSCAFTQHAESVSNYTLVTLQNRTITVDVVDYTTGSMIDSFSYTK